MSFLVNDEHRSHLRNQRLRFTPGFWALVLSPPSFAGFFFTCLFPLTLSSLSGPSSTFTVHTNGDNGKNQKAVAVVNQLQQKKKMLLGKRPRAPIKRTTSMSEITFDLNTATDVDPNNPLNRPAGMEGGPCPSWWKQPPPTSPAPIGLDQNRVLATVSPRNHRRQYSVDLGHSTPEFLRACSLCKRRLVPGRDIYMYRGDSAFCSLECRQQQMNQDERKDKCFVASKKQVVASPSGSQVAT